MSRLLPLLMCPFIVAGAAWAGEPAALPLRTGVSVRIVGPGAAAGEIPIDDSLLRYLASRGDRPAAEAEIDRLQKEHPQWQPPENLFTAQPAVPEQPLWDSFNRGDYAATRAEILKLQQQFPAWHPPSRLLELLAAAETSARLRAASIDADWLAIAQLAKSQPDQFACAQIDRLWLLAEAHQRLGRSDEATATYMRIIETCDNADHRFASLQKAKALLGDRAIRPLLEAEAARPKTPAQSARLAQLVKPPRRDPPALPAPIRRAYRADADVADARAAETAVDATRNGDAAQRLGWVYLEHDDADAALKWFAKASLWKPAADVTKGTALALGAAGKLDELAELATRHPEIAGTILDQARARTVDRAYAAGDNAAVLKLTANSDDPALVLLRAWTLARMQRPTEAGAAFEGVLALASATPAQHEEANYGRARSHLARGSLDGALAVLGGTVLRADHRMEVQAEVIGRQATRAFKDGNYRRCLMLIDQQRLLARPDRSLIVQEGWSHYHLGHLRRAEAIFAGLQRLLGDDDSVEGLRVVRAKLNGYAS